MKRIDLTVAITESLWAAAFQNEQMTAFGHVGTHFDVMNKEFPLENLQRNGRLFDVRTVRVREIAVDDLRKRALAPGDFVIFYTGFLAQVGYGTRAYFDQHPVLSGELIEYLIDRRVSLIGLDAAGMRRGPEHTPMDQYCADHGVFVVENLDHLGELHQAAGVGPFVVYTFPMSFRGMSGLPCRVVAEVQDRPVSSAD